MYTSAQQKTADLIFLAAKKLFLKKAVFSKCDDNDIIRATATIFERSKEIFIQIETLKKK